jgi:hypothetical protein
MSAYVGGREILDPQYAEYPPDISPEAPARPPDGVVTPVRAAVLV